MQYKLFKNHIFKGMIAFMFFLCTIFQPTLFAAASDTSNVGDIVKTLDGLNSVAQQFNTTGTPTSSPALNTPVPSALLTNSSPSILSVEALDPNHQALLNQIAILDLVCQKMSSELASFKNLNETKKTISFIENGLTALSKDFESYCAIPLSKRKDAENVDKLKAIRANAIELNEKLSSLKTSISEIMTKNRADDLDISSSIVNQVIDNPQKSAAPKPLLNSIKSLLDSINQKFYMGPFPKSLYENLSNIQKGLQSSGFDSKIAELVNSNARVIEFLNAIDIKNVKNPQQPTLAGTPKLLDIIPNPKPQCEKLKSLYLSVDQEIKDRYLKYLDYSKANFTYGYEEWLNSQAPYLQVPYDDADTGSKNNFRKIYIKYTGIAALSDIKLFSNDGTSTDKYLIQSGSSKDGYALQLTDNKGHLSYQPIKNISLQICAKKITYANILSAAEDLYTKMKTMSTDGNLVSDYASFPAEESQPGHFTIQISGSDGQKVVTPTHSLNLMPSFIEANHTFGQCTWLNNILFTAVNDRHYPYSYANTEPISGDPASVKFPRQNSSVTNLANGHIGFIYKIVERPETIGSQKKHTYDVYLCQTNIKKEIAKDTFIGNQGEINIVKSTFEVKYDDQLKLWSINKNILYKDNGKMLRITVDASGIRNKLSKYMKDNLSALNQSSASAFFQDAYAKSNAPYKSVPIEKIKEPGTQVLKDDTIAKAVNAFFDSHQANLSAFNQFKSDYIQSVLRNIPAKDRVIYKDSSQTVTVQDFCNKLSKDFSAANDYEALKACIDNNLLNTLTGYYTQLQNTARKNALDFNTQFIGALNSIYPVLTSNKIYANLKNKCSNLQNKTYGTVLDAIKSEFQYKDFLNTKNLMLCLLENFKSEKSLAGLSKSIDDSKDFSVLKNILIKEIRPAFSSTTVLNINKTLALNLLNHKEIKSCAAELENSPKLNDCNILYLKFPKYKKYNNTGYYIFDEKYDDGKSIREIPSIYLTGDDGKKSLWVFNNEAIPPQLNKPLNTQILSGQCWKIVLPSNQEASSDYFFEYLYLRGYIDMKDML